MANDKSLELQIRIASEEALRAIASLQGEIKSLANEAKKFAADEGENLEKSFKEAEAAAKDTSMSIGDIKKAIGSLTEVVAATKALSVIKDMGVFALKTADDFQTARNQFGTLLGDMEAGAGLFNEIKAFGDKTPFDLSTLTQATNVLISAKVPLNEMNDQLTKFGDLSQGNAQRFSSYINAFSQASAKGKADMQILNTYLNQGVPILDALAKNFGKTTAEVVEMSSQGKISFEEFSKALDDLTASGGQYFGGMELASESLASMQEGLQESVNSLGASIGEIFLPVAVAVVEILTKITNAINESPILKGLFVGALVGVAAYLGIMAVKATIAFAAQMSLNFAMGVTNPVILGATIAVAALAAGYVALAAQQQKAARENENVSLSMRKTANAIHDMQGAIRGYADEFSRLPNDVEIVRRMQSAVDPDDLRRQIEVKKQEIDSIQRDLEILREKLRGEGFSDFVMDLTDVDIQNYEFRIEKLKEEINRINLIIPQAEAEYKAITEGYQEFQRNRFRETAPVVDEVAQKTAERWFARWAEQYRKFKAETANDPFIDIQLNFEDNMNEARLHGASMEVIRQIEEVYAAERARITKEIYDEEKRLASTITKTKIDDLQFQLQKELEAINILEQKRIFAADESAAEIAKIREEYEQMREETFLRINVEINQTKLDEARDAVKNWQEELSDNLLLALMDLEMFGNQTSVILSDLALQLIELSASATLSGFEEFGRALGQGKDAAESLEQALAEMAGRILQQLPMMFMQAGLQLIANGQWAMGLGFIAAAGSTAIMSGYVSGVQEEAKAAANAHGNVYDEYGQGARAFAAGGTFTNQLVNNPTYFRFGGRLGVMGEAGPEAIVPLKRMPSGNLGVESGVGSTAVFVIIQNYTNEEVRTEESTDSGGNQIRKVIIGAVKESISNGEMDRSFASRYGIRAQGV